MKKTILSISILLSLIPLYAFAEGTVAVNTNASSSVIENITTDATDTPPQTFTTCSQEAIEKRDTSIAASRSAYNVTMTNALNERKNREKAAIALTDEDDKKDAIKVSVDTYKAQVKTAQNTLTETRKALWQDFEDDINTCRKLYGSDDQAPTTDVRPAAKMLKAEETDAKNITTTIKDKIETFLSIFKN